MILSWCIDTSIPELIAEGSLLRPPCFKLHIADSSVFNSLIGFARFSRNPTVNES